MIAHPLVEAAPAVSAGALRLPTPRTFRLHDGRQVRIRPIRPSDAEALRAFDSDLCETSHRFRYLAWMPPLSPEQAGRMATVDFRHRFALVATHDGVIVADCRLISEQDSGPTEIAIAVADGYQCAGLGTALLREMLSIAADHGIETVEARVRYDNGRMLRLLPRLGFRRTAWELGVVTFATNPRP